MLYKIGDFGNLEQRMNVPDYIQHV